MSFEFRLRFHLLPEDLIASVEQKLELPTPAAHLRLAAWKRDVPIEDGPRVFLVGGPYDSAELAREDGQRARKAVLLWALQRRLAINLGDNRKRAVLTAAGAEYFANQIGAPVRQQLHGLDVYEQIDGQRFIDINMQPGLRVGVDTAVSAIARWYADNPHLTEKQELAAELYCSAHFDAPFRSRFLTLMTALEAFLEYQPRADDVRRLVQQLEDLVESSQVEKREKQSLHGSLGWLYEESISQAGRRTARHLLPDGLYDGKSSDKYFSECYELRSTIVHTGRVPATIDLLDVTNELHRFVGDLLHADIGIRPAT